MALKALDRHIKSLCNPAIAGFGIDFGGYKNSYRIWLYRKSSQDPKCPAGIYETGILDENAGETLEKGGIVFLCPESTKEAMPNSIKSTFTTDFWSVGTFSSQEGSMGLLIDDAHPLFKDFPTSFHSDYQWFVPSSQRAMILPDGVRSIVTVLDSYATFETWGLSWSLTARKAGYLYPLSPFISRIILSAELFCHPYTDTLHLMISGRHRTSPMRS